jgi:hypothetical protein
LSDLITCPHCKEEFQMTEAMTGQIRADLEAELHKQLSKKTIEIEEAAKKKAKDALAVEMEDLKSRDEESQKKLASYQEQELSMRKKMRELEEQKQTMDLEMARKLDESRKSIEIETTKRVLEEKRMQDLEKEKQLSDMKAQVEELKHKMEVGSQQGRGEVQELDLEDILRTNFVGDDITPVGKGVLGADVIQHVRNRNGQLCEKIVWESKRTKHWSDQWVEKLKDDSRKMNGFVSVIVTETLPADVKGFSYYNGVWVTDYHSIMGLATALRMQIIHVCHVRDSMTGKGEKMSMLYDYLTSHQFRDRVEAIVETFQSMRTDLEKEREAMRRLWAKREKEIERITDNTIGMYGEMQGLIGSSLPTLASLDILAIEEGEGDDNV